MRWFLGFCWSYILTIKNWTLTVWQRLGTFIVALISRLKLKKPDTSTPTKTTTTVAAKSKRTANQGSSRKKPNSGTKRKKK